jgi:hypothetical protein
MELPGSFSASMFDGSVVRDFIRHQQFHLRHRVDDSSILAATAICRPSIDHLSKLGRQLRPGNRPAHSATREVTMFFPSRLTHGPEGVVALRALVIF